MHTKAREQNQSISRGAEHTAIQTIAATSYFEDVCCRIRLLLHVLHHAVAQLLMVDVDHCRRVQRQQADLQEVNCCVRASCAAGPFPGPQARQRKIHKRRRSLEFVLLSLTTRVLSHLHNLRPFLSTKPHESLAQRRKCCTKWVFLMFQKPATITESSGTPQLCFHGYQVCSSTLPVWLVQHNSGSSRHRSGDKPIITNNNSSHGSNNNDNHNYGYNKDKQWTTTTTAHKAAAAAHTPPARTTT